MKLAKQLGLRLFVLLIICVFLDMHGNAFQLPNSETTITNDPEFSNQSQPGQSSIFSQDSVPSISPHVPQGGVQVVRSLLGLEVKFNNNNVNYPGLTIVDDQRYQALSDKEKLVDSIKFQSTNAPPFLLLIAIAKNANGAPLIVPGKFDILSKTDQDGFVLRDSHGRLFYYSGYILATPAWKNLGVGQSLQDKFCKDSVPITMCTPQKIVNVILKKHPDPRKDIPFLSFVR